MKFPLLKPFLIVLTTLISTFTTVKCWADFQPNFFKTADGAKIRYAFWSNDAASQDKKTTIVFLQSRASFLEKNVDFISDLTKRGYSVASFDWRGMGGSDRVIDSQQRNHIDTFDTYLSDLDQFMTTILKQHAKNPVVILGLSLLGGHLGLRYLHDHPQQAEAIILSAPMLGFFTDPYPQWFAKPFVKIMSKIGFEDRYVMGYGDFDPNKARFSKNSESNDETRYLKTLETIKNHPEFVIGGPTYGWVRSAYDSLDILTNYSYLQNIRAPVLLIAAGDDHTVDNSHDEEYCHAMSKCTFKEYAHAAHNLTKNQDPVRSMLLQDIDQFIGQIDTLTKQAERF